MVAPPSPPLLGMYQTNGTFPTPGPSAWASGSRTNLTATYVGWGFDIPTYVTAFLTQCKNNSLFPFVELEPWTPTPILFTDITNGSWDTWLTGIGSAIAASGKPCILTFAHEMNISGQYPWSQGDSGSGPGGGSLSASNWITGWNYVRNKINSTAGGNALFMWACSAYTGGSSVSPAPWWPGSSNVDMVGIDGYPDTQYGASLGTFNGQLKPTVDIIRGFGWTDPIFLAETNLRQMVDSGGESITNFVHDMYTNGCSGILEFEDASWGLSQMTTAEWTEYNNAINATFGTSTGGGTGGTGGTGSSGGTTYIQAVYDNFDDNSFDTGKWNDIDSGIGPGYITETGGTLKLKAVSAEVEVDTTATFDTTKGFWAVKWSHTGTGTPDTAGDGSTGTETYFGFADAADHYVELQAWPVSNHWYSWADGVGATTSNDIGPANAFGAAWNDGDYIGIGNYNLAGDQRVHVYKSSDATTWTEVASFKITGAINMSAVKFFFGTHQLTGSSTWVSVFDEASTFAIDSTSSGGSGGTGGGSGVSYIQSVIDNFNDNSFNTSLWSTPNGSAGITETGGTLHINATNAYAAAGSPATFDVSKGILGAKVTRSGTATSSSELYVIAVDNAGNSIQFGSDPSIDFYYWDIHGATTHSGDVTSDGVGSAWTDGNWLGVGNYDPATGVIHAYKSPDGQTWTEIGRTTVGGTFNYQNTGVGVMCGDYGSAPFNFTGIFDDASTFLLTATPPAGGSTYTQTIIDNFNDNSFNTTIWATPNGTTGIVEASQILTITDGTTNPEIVSPTNFDLSTGLLAFKYSNSGTGSSGTSAYTQTVIDNFNDNSLNTTLWATPDGTTGLAETSTQMQLSSVTAYPELRGKTYYNITAGILAAKVSQSGTAAAETEVYFGVTDNTPTTPNGVFYLMDPASNSGAGGWSWIPAGGSATTVTSLTATDGLKSTGWTAGTWLGISMSGTTMTMWKSSNGTTWTAIATATIGGTFDPTHAALDLLCGYYGASSSTYKAIFDDASYFAGPTVSGATFFGIGVKGSAGNLGGVKAQFGVTSLVGYSGGAATVDTVTGNSADLLGSWTDGDWLGIGKMGSDNVVHVYHSADTITWTQIGSFHIGGTFTKTAVGLDVRIGHTSGTTTFVITLDDVSKFVQSGGSHTVKVRVAGAWVASTPKVRVAGAWVTAIPKVRVAGAWVTPA